MSRMDRLKEYEKASRSSIGAGRDQKNLDRMAERASENSYHGEEKPARTTGSGARKEALADKNIAGERTYMRGVRRQA